MRTVNRAIYPLSILDHEFDINFMTVWKLRLKVVRNMCLEGEYAFDLKTRSLCCAKKWERKRPTKYVFRLRLVLVPVWLWIIAVNFTPMRKLSPVECPYKCNALIFGATTFSGCDLMRSKCCRFLRESVHVNLNVCFENDSLDGLHYFRTWDND